jgi:peptide/nickel transport system substrate-binding protein
MVPEGEVRMRFRSSKLRVLLGAALVGGLAAAMACGGDKGTTTEVVERIVEVEKIIEVPVERIVTKEVPVEVIREVVIEKVVEKEVIAGPTDARFGGELVMAMTASIPTLDVHRTTATNAGLPSMAVQERLIAFDAEFTPQPLLVDTWKVSSDGLQWTFKLRPGNKFHDGTVLTAEHAVASWNRWADRDSFGGIVLDFIDDVRAVDDVTFVFDMVESTSLLLDAMSSMGGYPGVVMPPSMYNVPAAEGTEEMIGTGPYKFTEWIPGDRLSIDRYDDYQPSPLAPSGLSGHKTAYFDTVTYLVVPDINARMAAIRTGQIDATSEIPSDFVLAMVADPVVEVMPTRTTREGAWLDNVEGVFTDARVRRAFAMAYPVEDALAAAFGDSQFWNPCPSMMLCDWKWGGFPDGSAGLYNVHDSGGLEAARVLIREAGVEGADVIVLSAEDRPRFSRPAEISRQTLERMGFNVIFKATDWATQTNWREKPELWDVFHTAGGGFWGQMPLANSSLQKNKYWNKYQDESGRMTQLMSELARAGSGDKQLEIVKQMQLVFWEDVPYLPFGDSQTFAGKRREIAGMDAFQSFLNVYNAWRTQ